MIYEYIIKYFFHSHTPRIKSLLALIRCVAYFFGNFRCRLCVSVFISVVAGEDAAGARLIIAVEREDLHMGNIGQRCGKRGNAFILQIGDDDRRKAVGIVYLLSVEITLCII